MRRLKTLAVLGTRPEAIKMVPVLRHLRHHEKVELVVVATSQHREMLDQVLQLFGLVPDIDLDIMQARQSLNEIVRRAVAGLDRVMHERAPDVLLVQGDTTTAFTAALAAFHRRIPVGHIEAGLRSYDPYNPYPEEVNRRLISGVASIHFAPTEQSAKNLLREGVSPERIYRTGNTIVDCLLEIVHARANSLANYLPPHFQLNGHRLILVTAHRRESWHEPIQELCEAVAELARELPDARILYPVHLNPVVRETVFPVLSGLPNVALTQPVALLYLCRGYGCVLSDLDPTPVVFRRKLLHSASQCWSCTRRPSARKAWRWEWRSCGNGSACDCVRSASFVS